MFRKKAPDTLSSKKIKVRVCILRFITPKRFSSNQYNFLLYGIPKLNPLKKGEAVRHILPAAGHSLSCRLIYVKKIYISAYI